MKVGTAVIYNDGSEEGGHTVALVEHADGSTLNLIVFGPGSPLEHKTDVPLREPKDYGPEGGGHTWHPVHT